MYNIKNISETFLFDGYYNTLSEAKSKAATDGILPGRYILIEYTETLFTLIEKITIKKSKKEELSGDKLIWYENWEKENESNRDYDRVICQKVFENEAYTYTPLYRGESDTAFEWEEF